MTTVNKINTIGVNSASLTTLQENNKTSKTSLKQYLTATNIILGSLATIGVLGMADVLICKGKHINKLTGKGKELEEALTRATEAESRTTNTQTEIQRLQSIINNFNENKKGLRLHETGQGINVLEWLQRVYAEEAGDSPVIEKEIRKLMKLSEYEFTNYTEQLANNFEISAANIPVEVTTKPAIIDKRTGEIVLNGVHCTPM